MKKRFLDEMDMPAPRKSKRPTPPMSDEMDMGEDEEGLEDALFGSSEEADEMAGPLADVSDDDLLAEARKRGLPVSEPEEEEPADEEEDDLADDDDMV